jgi:hypothetical protein
MTLGLSAAAIGALAVGAGGIASAVIGGNAAQSAASTQAAATEQGIQAQQAEFAQIQKLLSPFVTQGQTALTTAGNIAGINGNPAQQAAVSGIAGSPIFQGMNVQGQNAILQNASATGGLRGGNVQAALAQFSPQLLNQLLQQQYGQASGLATIGANAGAGLATAGQSNVNAQSNLMTLQGAQQAGGILGSAQAYNSGLNSIASGLGVFKGLGGSFNSGSGAGYTPTGWSPTLVNTF